MEFNYKVNETTEKYVREKLERRFRRTGNAIYVEKPFIDLVCWNVRKEVPAYLRTEEAVRTNPIAIAELEGCIEKFLREIESGKKGWQWCKKRNGLEELKLFSENGIEIVDWNWEIDEEKKEEIDEEERFRNQIKRLMKMNEEKEEGEEGDGRDGREE